MTYTIEELNKMINRSGGWLNLRGTQITSLPDNLTVGGELYGFNYKRVRKPKEGEYVEGKYLYCDNILTHVVKKRKIHGFDFYQGKIRGENVVSDGTYYSHCDKFSAGVRDILFKHCKDRGQEQYSEVSVNDSFTPDEMIAMYRIITGACLQGSENFVNTLGKLKNKYTVREAMELTKGQYGSDAFAEFFGGRE